MNNRRTFRRRARCLSLLWFVGAAGCSAKEPSVGQSGSEELPGKDPFPGGATDPCPCALVGRDALRVTVLEQEADLVRMRVEEILLGDPPLAVGDELEATRYDDDYACYSGCFAIQPGDEAFAFYRANKEPWVECEARSACLDACKQDNIATYGRLDYQSACMCRSEPSARASERRTCGMTTYFGPDEQGRDCRAECEQETAETCPPPPSQDFKRGTVRLSPWSDPIVFARGPRGEVSVRVADLTELSSSPETFHACRERFGDWVDVVELPH